jgi:hypothetical protein
MLALPTAVPPPPKRARRLKVLSLEAPQPGVDSGQVKEDWRQAWPLAQANLELLKSSLKGKFDVEGRVVEFDFDNFKSIFDEYGFVGAFKEVYVRSVENPALSIDPLLDTVRVDAVLGDAEQGDGMHLAFQFDGNWKHGASVVLFDSGNVEWELVTQSMPAIRWQNDDGEVMTWNRPAAAKPQPKRSRRE